jgi:hypothetical protein
VPLLLERHVVHGMWLWGAMLLALAVHSPPPSANTCKHDVVAHHRARPHASLLLSLGLDGWLGLVGWLGLDG